MNDDESNLRNLVLAPYILKGMALVKVVRKSGGNQFRHSFSILGILFSYKYFNDSVLLKASLLHDYLEDLVESTVEEISGIDSDGPEVVKLVLEVTRQKWETKSEYLKRILN
jgi:GTP pyrophosphokinase